jgi:cardiolipin synthase
MSWFRYIQRRSIRSLLRGGYRYIFGKRGQRRVHGWRIFYRLRVEVLLHGRKPVTGINRFPDARIWVDREAFPRIKKLLRRARHTIVIQMFIWKDDTLGREMAALLLTCADRGVKVYISKEAVGDVFEFHRDFLTTRTGYDPLWRKFWAHPNIRISYANNNDHAKVFIIDDRIFLLTGMNIADEYHEKWHDYLVELRGNHFVEYYLTRGEAPVRQTDTRLIMNTDVRKDIRPAMMMLLESARRSIVLEQSYLSDDAINNLLIRKSKEGVRVTVILPSRPDFHYYANMQSVGRLIAEGDSENINVFLFPGMVHGKITIVDRTSAFIGSANMMTSSLDEMGEVNVLIEGKNRRPILKLREVLRLDVVRSEPLRTPPRLRWLTRGLAWLKL